MAATTTSSSTKNTKNKKKDDQIFDRSSLVPTPFPLSLQRVAGKGRANCFCHAKCLTAAQVAKASASSAPIAQYHVFYSNRPKKAQSVDAAAAAAGMQPRAPRKQKAKFTRHCLEFIEVQQRSAAQLYYATLECCLRQAPDVWYPIAGLQAEDSDGAPRPGPVRLGEPFGFHTEVIKDEVFRTLHIAITLQERVEQRPVYFRIAAYDPLLTSPTFYWPNAYHHFHLLSGGVKIHEFTSTVDSAPSLQDQQHLFQPQYDQCYPPIQPQAEQQQEEFQLNEPDPNENEELQAYGYVSAPPPPLPLEQDVFAARQVPRLLTISTGGTWRAEPDYNTDRELPFVGYQQETAEPPQPDNSAWMAFLVEDLAVPTS